MLTRLGMLGVIFVFASASLAHAEATGPGCGFGKMIWAGQKGIAPQVLAATTNGTSGSQTFGITSGTLGCTQDGVVMNDRKVDVFASVNFENLKEEMAQGRGEYLASFATLLSVPADHQLEFFALTQERYTTLFKSTQTTPSEMLIALNQEISAHPTMFEVGGNR